MFWFNDAWCNLTLFSNKIVIQSACAAADGICQCDIELKQPTEQYMDGYTSIVLDYVKQVDNKGFKITPTLSYMLSLLIRTFLI